MSVNKRFELYKVNREIKRSGEEFAFYKKKKNKYGEETGELELLGKLKGIYHESSSAYFNLIISEGANIQTKSQPGVLTTFEATNAITLEKNHILLYNGGTFVVNKVNNIQEWGIIADISLTRVEKEIVTNGTGNDDSKVQ